MARLTHSPLVLTTSGKALADNTCGVGFLVLVSEVIIFIPLSSLQALLHALGVKIPWLRP